MQKIKYSFQININNNTYIPSIRKPECMYTFNETIITYVRGILIYTKIKNKKKCKLKDTWHGDWRKGNNIIRPIIPRGGEGPEVLALPILSYKIALINGRHKPPPLIKKQQINCRHLGLK